MVGRFCSLFSDEMLQHHYFGLHDQKELVLPLVLCFVSLSGQNAVRPTSLPRSSLKTFKANESEGEAEPEMNGVKVVDLISCCNI